MKHQNTILTVTLVTLAFAFAPAVHARRPDGGPARLHQANAAPSPDGGPITIRSAPTARVRPTPAARPNTTAVTEANRAESAESSANAESEQEVQMPVVSIHAVDNVARGEIGTFVLAMKPAMMLGGIYVKYSVGGTAIQGVDYVALASSAYIGPSGYAVIQIQTLPDPRGSGIRQAYSVVITLEDGAGYSVDKSRSATMWIKP